MGSNEWGTKEWFDSKVDYHAGRPEGYFGHGVNGYQRYRHRWIGSQLKQATNESEVKCIVELGCGAGDLLECIKTIYQQPSAIGLDFIERLIALASKRFPDSSFRVAALPEIPLEKDFADLVIASEVLYYLEETAQKRTLRNVHRVLRTDGWCVVTSAIGPKYLSAEKIERLMQKNGFRVIAVSYLHARLYKLIASVLQKTALFESYMNTGTVSERHRNTKLYKAFSTFFRIPVFRPILFFSAKLARCFLRNRKIPVYMEKIGRLLGRSTRNSVMVVAQKVGA